MFTEEVVGYINDGFTYCDECKDAAYEDADPNTVRVLHYHEEVNIECGSECDNCEREWLCTHGWSDSVETEASLVEEAVEDFLTCTLPDSLSPRDWERYFNEHSYSVSNAALKIELAKTGMQQFGDSHEVSDDIDSFLDRMASYAIYGAACSKMSELVKEHDLDHCDLSDSEPEIKIVVKRDDLIVGWGDDKDEPEAWEILKVDLGHKKKFTIWKKVYYDSIEDDLDIEERLSLLQLDLEFEDEEGSSSTAA